jgi:hypothetical protein
MRPIRSWSPLRHGFGRRTAWIALLWWGAATLATPAVAAGERDPTGTPRRIGVIYVVHGGPSNYGLSNSWDGAVQMAAYDEHSLLYREMIWNPAQWSKVLGLHDPQSAQATLPYYRRAMFMMSRVGGWDPTPAVTAAQAARLGQVLAARGRSRGLEIITDWASWIAGTTEVRHLPYPRFIYDRAGQAPAAVTYCGSLTDGGRPPDSRWPGCDPKRYDVDGPVERLLAAGAEVLLLIDTTVGGVRFSKTHDVLRFARLARDATLRGTGRTVPLLWVNDPTGLLDESYPTSPANWTRSLGPPVADRVVPLAGRGNPVTDDPAYARIVAEGILGAFNPEVPAADTGILLFNHGIHPGSEVFDPKIDDTVVVMENLRRVMVERAPGLKPERVLGGWMGVAEQGPKFVERNRAMRGEDIGHAFLYESAQRMPAAPWGGRYWEALDQLRAAGVRHIVVVFPHVIVSASPAVVDLPNQIAKEIGYRSFHPSNELTEPRWPGFGNPFADRWPVTAPRLCHIDGPQSGLRECCYRLGGCGPDSPYPERRQTPMDRPISAFDPALTYDIPAFGHLGYRAEGGAPDNDRPVQSQYRGTWSLWAPMDDDPRLADYLADKVLAAIPGP